ncbi:MAG: Methyl transferase, putative, family protein [Acidimicrobiia bacterium]|nr:Methyl transferase, putative, family protein [Acidimicrobiia bacterium]
MPSDMQLFSDPLADLFIDERAIAAARADVGLQQSIRLRTRYIDEAVLAFAVAYPGAQVLLLGAGLDARAYRLVIDASFFEVDFPATLEYKAAKAAAAGLVSPPHRKVVPVDLANETIEQPLVAAGFDRNCPTIVVWEGVINYLTNAECEAVVAELAALVVAGSQLVADYVEISSFAGEFKARTRSISSDLGEGGEPLRSGLHDVKGTLGAAGFDVIDDEAVELLPPRYGEPLKPRKYPARIFTAVRR